MSRTAAIPRRLPSFIERCCSGSRISGPRGRIWPRSRSLATERRSRSTRSPAIYSGSPAVPSLAHLPSPPLLVAPTGRASRGLPLGSGDTMKIQHVAALPHASELDPSRPTVVLLDLSLLEGIEHDRRRVAELAGVAAIVGLGDPGADAPDPAFPTALLSSYFAADAPAATVHTLLRGAFRHAVSLVAAYLAREERAMRHRELAELTSVGVALSTERNLLALLEMILTQARSE